MFPAILPAKALKFAAVALVTASLAACASKTDDQAGAGGRLGYGAGGAGSAAPGSVQDFAQNVGDRVFFETDSSELTAAGVATLDKQAAWLNQYGRHSFAIEGHADERGTREYNFALGARRAETVKNYLAAKGISTARMRSTSYGKEKPVAVCDNISCWSQNRRARTALAGAGS